jgi:hypothetical protein
MCFLHLIHLRLRATAGFVNCVSREKARIAGEGAYRGRRWAGVGEFAHLILTGCSGLITHAEAEKGMPLFARECKVVHRGAD